MTDKYSYYLFYKPYNVLNQFTKERPEHSTLADFLKVEKDVYPVGRLDKDSEGLLILTNDPSLNAALLRPAKGHNRVYAVQVDGEIQEEALRKVRIGVDIKLDTGTYRTRPCEAKKLSKEPLLPERNPPIRYRAAIPTSWVLITLQEGKNRQVRKMMAAVGYPVLRLVRLQIEDVKIGKLKAGESIKLSREELYSLLKIETIQKTIERKTSSQNTSQRSEKSSTTAVQHSSKKGKGSFVEWRKQGGRKPKK